MRILRNLPVVMIFALTFIACGDSDDVDNNSILGKWELIDCIDDSYWEKPCIFNFRENNMLTITFASGLRDEEAVPCKYTTSGSKLVIDFGYGDDVYEGTYKISNNTMTFDMVSYDPEDPEDIEEDFLTLNRIK